MSGKNLVRKEFPADGTWTCPAGVQQVTAKVFGILSTQMGAGAGASGMCASVNTYGNQCYTWGGNQNGQGGRGNVLVTSSPQLVVNNFPWHTISVGVDNTFGITERGEAHAWGLNTNGQLGLGDVGPRSSPVVIPGVAQNWRTISGGASTVGIAVSGDAYAWGLNTNGQLGVGDVTPRSSPTIILGSKKWIQVVSARSTHMAGIDSTGAAYTWGLNTNGQLGTGNTTVASSPVLVVGGKTWKRIAASAGTSAGGGFTIGIDQNNDAYAWGANTHGQCGTNAATAAYSSPVLVVGGLKWRYIAAGGDSVIGITVDGVAYAWGRNESGQLGDGSTVSKSSPVLIAGSYTFRQASLGFVSGSALGYAIGITTSGLTYTWGSNVNGQLGTNDVVARSSPTIIVGPSTWRSIDTAMLSEQIVPVTPGVTYSVVQFAQVTRFGPASLYTDPYGGGSIPNRVVLEYFA